MRQLQHNDPWCMWWMVTRNLVNKCKGENKLASGSTPLSIGLWSVLEKPPIGGFSCEIWSLQVVWYDCRGFRICHGAVPVGWAEIESVRPWRLTDPKVWFKCINNFWAILFIDTGSSVSFLQNPTLSRIVSERLFAKVKQLYWNEFPWILTKLVLGYRCFTLFVAQHNLHIDCQCIHDVHVMHDKA